MQPATRPPVQPDRSRRCRQRRLQPQDGQRARRRHERDAAHGARRTGGMDIRARGQCSCICSDAAATSGAQRMRVSTTSVVNY